MFDKDFLNVVDRVSDIFIDFMEEKGFDVSYHNDKYFGDHHTTTILYPYKCSIKSNYFIL